MIFIYTSLVRGNAAAGWGEIKTKKILKVINLMTVNDPEPELYKAVILSNSWSIATLGPILTSQSS